MGDEEVTHDQISREADASGTCHAGVGDVNSNARGSGARYNTGKPPLELIPVWIIAARETRKFGDVLADDGSKLEAQQVLQALGKWQRGTGLIGDAIDALQGDAWTDCARVFDYGRRKYAAWNWAKGMAWSVPTACATRHLLAILRGEENDPESGLPHRGHVMCNLVMLAQYELTYREGDDRPKQIMQAA
jgi:hypothetical protein